MSKSKFKVGDSVFAVENDAWGLAPMTILSESTSNGYSCQHPDLGIGYFITRALRKVTPFRLIQIAKYNRLKRKLENYRDNILFKKKYGK